jgi:predicted DCC family thiol-disulfide oxidoreductase YuxK
VIERHRTTRAALRSRAAAALVVADALGWPWRATRVLGILPRAWLDAGYDRVARHRHVILGRAETCFVPTPEHRARFLDAG